MIWLARALIIGVLVTLLGCGGRATNDSLVRDESAGPTGPAGTSLDSDPGDAIVPGSPTVDAVEPRDSILDHPDLAPGVASVVQPSYFAEAPSATDVGIATVGDGGGNLGGTGDLTVLLVFDKSSSMLLNWDGKTRWQVANESLRGALDGILDVLTIGVIRFPLEQSCGVPEFDSGLQIDFTTGRGFVQVWQTMEHRLESLGTPLYEALSVADRAIDQARGEGRLSQRFRVVLVTDGEPNCGGHIDSMTHLVATWFEEGIETLVIGLPGSAAGSFVLDALADAGGTGTVTMTATEAELDGELAQALR